MKKIIIPKDNQELTDKLFEPEMIKKIVTEQEKAYRDSKSIREMTNISWELLHTKYN